MAWDIDRVMNELFNRVNENYLKQSTQQGIDTKLWLGVPISELRLLAKAIQLDHLMGWSLWEMKIYECKVLSSMLMDPILIADEDADYIVSGIDSWQMSEQFCANLFRVCPNASSWAISWSDKKRLNTRITGYQLIIAICTSNIVQPNNLYRSMMLAIRNTIVGDARPGIQPLAIQALTAISKKNLETKNFVTEVCVHLEKSGDRIAVAVANTVEMNMK